MANDRWDGQGSGRNMIGKLVTKKWGMKYIDLSEWAKKMGDICVPRECSSKGALRRRGLESPSG